LACDDLLVDQDDPEQRIADLERQLANQRRIADLERQLAEAKAAAREEPDEHAQRFAQALFEGLQPGAPSGPDGPSEPEMARIREALQHAAADAGLGQTQINDAVQNGHVTIKTGRSVVYSGLGNSQNVGAPAGFAHQAEFRRQIQLRKTKADRVGAILGVVGGVLGICVGGAAAITAMFPSTALWMSPIICRSPYELAYNSSHYSYKPGQSGTSVSFQCVSDANAYDVNQFAITGLQSVLIALVLCVGVVVFRLIRRQTRNQSKSY
jgi:hypothetical protein